MIHIYCFPSSKLLLISDHLIAKVRRKFGHRYEILTSIREKASIEVVLPRIIRSYHGYDIKEYYIKTRLPFTIEHRRKISLANSLRIRTEESKRRTSLAMAGRSNFQGKRHKWETKEVMSEKAMGNKKVLGLYWCHNPITGQERRVKDRNDLPAGFVLGRDYYSVEAIKAYRR